MFPLESNANYASSTQLNKATAIDPPSPQVPVEVGFFARILYQDATYPWRYAFVGANRQIDPTYQEIDPAGDMVSHPEIQFFNSFTDTYSDGTDATNFMVYGERSLWNNYFLESTPSGEMIGVRFDDQGNPTQTMLPIAQGEVVLFAEEVNHRCSVPHDAIVWMRTGEMYLDGNSGFPQKDYLFQWTGPFWAEIGVSGCTSPSDTYSNGDYVWTEVYRNQLKNDSNPDSIIWDYSPLIYINNASGHSSNPEEGDGGGFVQVLGQPDAMQISVIDPAREVNGYPVLPGTIVQVFQGQPIEYNSDATLYSQEYNFSAPYHAETVLTLDSQISGNSSPLTISNPTGASWLLDADVGMPPWTAQIEVHTPATYDDFSVVLHKDGWWETSLDFQVQPGPLSTTNGTDAYDNSAVVTAELSWTNPPINPPAWNVQDEVTLEFHSGVTNTFMRSLTTNGTIQMQGTGSNQRGNFHRLLEVNSGAALRVVFTVAQNFTSPPPADWQPVIVLCKLTLRWAGKNTNDF